MWIFLFLQLCIFYAGAIAVAASPALVAAALRNSPAAWVAPVAMILSTTISLMLLLNAEEKKDDDNNNSHHTTNNNATKKIQMNSNNNNKMPLTYAEFFMQDKKTDDPQQRKKNNNSYYSYSMYGSLLVILTLALGALIAYAAAFMVCDQLTRAVWTRASSGDMHYSMWPRSRLPELEYHHHHNNKNDDVRWDIIAQASDGASSNECSLEETDFMVLGRHSVFGSVAVSIVSFIAPIIAMHLGVNDGITFISAAGGVITGIVALVLANDAVWDWRPLFAYFSACALSCYLVTCWQGALEKSGGKKAIIMMMIETWIAFPRKCCG